MLLQSFIPVKTQFPPWPTLRKGSMPCTLQGKDFQDSCPSLGLEKGEPVPKNYEQKEERMALKEKEQDIEHSKDRSHWCVFTETPQGIAHSKHPVKCRVRRGEISWSEDELPFPAMTRTGPEEQFSCHSNCEVLCDLGNEQMKEVGEVKWICSPLSKMLRPRNFGII